MSNAEDLALRDAHPMYAAWEDDRGNWPEEEYDPWAEGEALWELYEGR